MLLLVVPMYRDKLFTAEFCVRVAVGRVVGCPGARSGFTVFTYFKYLHQ